MTNLVHHALYLGGSLQFNGLVNFCETQGANRTFLVLAAVNGALNLCDFNLCHGELTVKYFLKSYGAVLCHGKCIAHVDEGINGRLHHVVRVG